MKRLLPFLSALVLSAPPALAGPFGFDTSSKKNPADVYDYCEIARENRFSYDQVVICTSAPNQHLARLKDFYAIRHVSGVGVCSITSLTYNVDDDTGVNTRVNTDEIAHIIRSMYGPWMKK